MSNRDNLMKVKTTVTNWSYRLFACKKVTAEPLRSFVIFTLCANVQP